jgi:hypothetical protein
LIIAQLGLHAREVPLEVSEHGLYRTALGMDFALLPGPFLQGCRNLH